MEFTFAGANSGRGLRPVCCVRHDEWMLCVSADSLPQNALAYAAFRVALRDTVERIGLAHQVGTYGGECFGFLTEVPFLRAVAPHVQVDLLAATWGKHCSSDHFEASLIDEAVICAVCETAAGIAESRSEDFHRLLASGPRRVDHLLEVPVHELAHEMRALHLDLDSAGDFLMISQFEDMSPSDARPMKEEFGIEPAQEELLFYVLGLWTMSIDFMANISGLLTNRELAWAVSELASKRLAER